MIVAKSQQRRLILEAWEAYRDRLPLDASMVRVVETRRAFYVGAMALLKAISDHLPPGENPLKDDKAVWQALRAEIKAFADELKAGRG